MEAMRTMCTCSGYKTSKCLLEIKLYHNSFWCDAKYCLYFIYARKMYVRLHEKLLVLICTVA